MATDIASLQFSVDSTDAVDASEALDDLTNAANRTEKAVKQTGNTSQQAANKTKQLAVSTNAAKGALGAASRSAGQAAIQFQQFAGQVQGGTAFMTALSQQAADMGIVLGAPLVGVIVSLGAVLVGTLSSAFASTTDKLKDLSKEIRESKADWQEFTQAQKNVLILDLQKQIEAETKALEEQRKPLDDLQKLQAGLVEQIKRRQAAGQDKAVARLQARLEKLNATYSEEAIRLGISTENYNIKNAAVDKHVQKIEQLQNEIDVLNGAVSKGEEATPWWGTDESVEAAAFEIRMNLFRKHQEDLQAAIDQRNETLRQDWLATQEEPWMVGVPDPDKVAEWLDRVDAEKAKRREDELLAEQAAAEERIRIREFEYDANSRIANSLVGVFLDAAERKSKGDTEQAKKSFEVWKQVNSALIVSNGAAAIINALKYGDPATKWFDVAATGAETLRQFAANDALRWQGGGAPSAPSPPATQTNNNVNNNVTVNVSGGNSDNVVKAIQQYFDQDGQFVT